MFNITNIPNYVKVAIFHIIIISPMFYKIAIDSNNIPLYIYNALTFMGFYLLYNFRNHYKFKNYYQSIFSSHLLIIAPLIIYIGINKQNSHKYAFLVLKYMSYITLLLHIYILYTRLF